MKQKPRQVPNNNIIEGEERDRDREKKAKINLAIGSFVCDCLWKPTRKKRSNTITKANNFTYMLHIRTTTAAITQRWNTSFSLYIYIFQLCQLLFCNIEMKLMEVIVPFCYAVVVATVCDVCVSLSLSLFLIAFSLNRFVATFLALGMCMHAVIVLRYLFRLRRRCTTIYRLLPVPHLISSFLFFCSSFIVFCFF